MFERHLFDHYHLFCNERVMVGHYEGFYTDDGMYILVPCEKVDSEEITEAVQLSNHLSTTGELGIANIVTSVNGSVQASIDGEDVFLFKVPNHSFLASHDREQPPLATQLAHLHQRGRSYPLRKKEQTYFKNWKFFWEKRLQQLEQWYSHILYSRNKTDFDEVFLTSFPYYMGLTENAIQYVVDSELDEYYSKLEGGTVCHKRFTDSTWLHVDEKTPTIKLPTDFVYDHSSRDISEWIRHKVRDEGYSSETIYHFINSYEQHEPLTRYTRRLIYGRLLFPLFFFESVEGYYRSKMDWQKQYYMIQLEQLINSEADTISYLSKLAPYWQIPEVDWLIYKKHS